MEALLKSILHSDDLGWRIVGWLITLCIAMGTLLYKGIWARIKQVDAKVDSNTHVTDQLVGAHNTMAHLCGGNAIPIIERRADPGRKTVEGFVPLHNHNADE